MKPVTGIFTSQENLIHAVDAIRSAGFPGDKISVLCPGRNADKQVESLPATEAEQPGIGKAIGGVVGGAMGLAGGMQLGLGLSTLLIPGVGPVLAAGFAGGALLGALGVAGGVATGEALEEATTEGLPKDELFVYEDALRKGRSVLVAYAETDEQAEVLRDIMTGAGAER